MGSFSRSTRECRDFSLRARLARAVLLRSSMNHIAITTALLAATCFAGCAAPQTASLASAPTAASQSSASAQPQASRIVEGDLDITNRTSLEGFENLEVVTGTLTILGNTRLSSLDGLENLRAVKHLVISENVNLGDIEGLSGLRHAKTVTITGNTRLENLHGLESIRRVDRLVVTKNGIFCTSGLGGLKEAGDVVISNNPRLLSLRGLTNLTSVDNVTISNNPRLSAESGLLDNLREVSGKLDIRSNVGLQASEVEATSERFSKPVTVAAR
jgi:hypothetical protein